MPQIAGNSKERRARRCLVSPLAQQTSRGLRASCHGHDDAVGCRPPLHGRGRDAVPHAASPISYPSPRRNPMTVQHNIDMTRLAQLEQRVQALEDINAIRHLKAQYAAYCDDHYNPDGLAVLFTEDAVWESQGLGRFAGRDAIREFFRGASQLFTFAIHYSLNGQIDVQGDTARAQWYLFMPCTLGEGNRAMWRAGIDQEEYIRVAGEWKFTRKTSAPLFHTPFEDGWAKTR